MRLISLMLFRPTLAVDGAARMIESSSIVSDDTVRIKILSGLHAGGTLNLSVGSYRLSQQRDADIVLRDWSGPGVVIDVEVEGRIQIRPEFLHAPSDETPIDMAFQPNQPIVYPYSEDPRVVLLRHGDVLVAAGAVSAVWPSDIALLRQDEDVAVPAESELEHAIHGQEEHARGRSRKRVAVSIGLGAAAFIVCSGLVSVSVRDRPPKTAQAATIRLPLPMSVRLSDALRAAGLQDLHVSQQAAGRYLITGMVRDADQAARAQTIVAGEKDISINTRFDIASDILDALTTALQEPGVSARYEGHGAFLLTGIRRNAGTEAVIKQLRADESANIAGIEDKTTDKNVDTVPTLPYSAMLRTGSLRYGQLPDGSKYLVENAR